MPPHPSTRSANAVKSLWTFSTYFAEGFPYTVIRTIASVFFRDRGMSLEALGVTSVFGLPWVLKFLWGPHVDAFGTKRQWLLLCEVLLCLVILVAAVLSPLPHGPTLVALVFFVGSFIAATHDIAIDGFYMEALTQAEQAQYLGWRVMAYRIAMMTGTGVIVTLGAVHGWSLAFALSSLIMVLLCLLHWRILPRSERQLRPLPNPARIASRHLGTMVFAALLVALAWRYNQAILTTPLAKRFPEIITIGLFAGLLMVWLLRHRLDAFLRQHPESFYGKSFLSFIDRPRLAVTLGFIILSRTGEYMFSSMYSPFLIDLGLKSHYGWISAVAGLPCSIGGAMLGGWLIGRTSLRRMAMPFLAIQNLSILVYLPLGLYFADTIAVNTGNPAPQPTSLALVAVIAITHGFDQVAAGLGTAVLMTFLMRVCRPEFKASHYAIGTGLMSLSGLYAGVTSGFLTKWVGYGYFFGISFLLSLPGMLLLLALPLPDEPPPSS